MTQQLSAPTIGIVTAGVQPAINQIFFALGRGPASFSVMLCDDVPEATYESPVTHYLMADMSAMQSDVETWAAMAQNKLLPALPTGVVWGENGIISEAAAQAALDTPDAMVLFPAYGLQTQQDRDNWLATALQNRGVRILPDEPF
jgi:hypothetical protein